MKLLNDIALGITKLMTRQLSPVSRAKLVRDAVSPKVLSENLPPHFLMNLMLQSAKRLPITGMVVHGRLGDFFGNPQDQVIFRKYAVSGEWAPKLHSEVYDRVFSEKTGTLIDVGANIGLTCIPVAARNDGVNCYAIEADPDNFSMLCRNIQLNSMEGRVEAHNIAAYSAHSTLQFELSDNNFGDHRIRFGSESTLVAATQGEERRRIISVKAVPLDSIIAAEQLRRPIFLKVDTQGTEPMVFAGARSLLHHADGMVVEFSPYLLARAGQTPDSLISHLSEFDYGVIIPSDDNHEKTSTTNVSTPPKLLPQAELFAECRRLSANTDPDNYFDLLLISRKSGLASRFT